MQPLDYAQSGNYPECVELLVPVTKVSCLEQCVFFYCKRETVTNNSPTAVKRDVGRIGPTVITAYCLHFLLNSCLSYLSCCWLLNGMLVLSMCLQLRKGVDY